MSKILGEDEDKLIRKKKKQHKVAKECVVLGRK